jgi:hypothetical protein
LLRHHRREYTGATKRGLTNHSRLLLRGFLCLPRVWGQGAAALTGGGCASTNISEDEQNSARDLPCCEVHE